MKGKRIERMEGKKNKQRERSKTILEVFAKLCHPPY